MINRSFAKNYLNSYLTSGLSIVLNFLSMFIVTPRLTEHPQIFGIFTLCLSTTVFLTYADLGFLGAAAKFSAEAYARKEKDKEVKVLGFSTAILLIGAVLFSIITIIAGLNPGLLVKDINSDQSIVGLARVLFFILAFSAPIIVLQRCIMIFFQVRVEDYIFQRINIITGFIRVLSVFYFFRAGTYDIIGYFAFTQVLVLIALVSCIVIIRQRYDIKMFMFIKNIRLSRDIFFETKAFAFSSLLAIISWVIYYELDPIAISRFLGAEKTAIYAVVLTMMAVLRTLFGVIYTPFATRFNHFVGVNDEDGIKNFYLKVVLYTTPFVIIPVLLLIIFMKNILLCWVGEKFVESIPLGMILMASYFFSSVSYPTGSLLIARGKLSIVNKISFILPLLYWSGIFVFINIWGLKAFAGFKLLMFTINAVIYLVIAFKYLKGKVTLVMECVLPFLVSLGVMTIFVLLFYNALPVEKGKIQLLYTMIVIALISFVSITAWVAVHKSFRNELIGIYHRFFNKKVLV